jgi:hypothetical protein
VDKKTKLILLAVAILAVYSAGFFTSQGLNKRAVSGLNTKLIESADRITGYKNDLDTITKRLGESEDTLKDERIRNSQYIEDIEYLETELAEAELRNREIIKGVGGVQESLGGIAGRVNSGSGLIDGCLKILKSASDG